MYCTIVGTAHDIVFVCICDIMLHCWDWVNRNDQSWLKKCTSWNDIKDIDYLNVVRTFDILLTIIKEYEHNWDDSMHIIPALNYDSWQYLHVFS